MLNHNKILIWLDNKFYFKKTYYGSVLVFIKNGNIVHSDFMKDVLCDRIGKDNAFMITKIWHDTRK